MLLPASSSLKRDAVEGGGGWCTNSPPTRIHTKLAARFPTSQIESSSERNRAGRRVVCDGAGRTCNLSGSHQITLKMYLSPLGVGQSKSGASLLLIPMKSFLINLEAMVV